MFSICMLFGVSLTSAVAAGIIMAAIPATVALMSWVFLRERIGLRIGAAMACAVVGIGLLSLTKQASEGHTTTSLSWLGNLLLLGAVLCEAAYAVIGKKLTGTLSPKRISALINLWGFALVTPMGLWTALTFNFAGVPASLWLLLVFYGLAASVWTVWLWMTGLKTIPAAKAGIFTVMLPVSAACVGVLVLDESLSPAQMFALGMALVGVLLATLPDRAVN
jgi:drug/metabolite transporter (DMT)-like permease